MKKKLLNKDYLKEQFKKCFGLWIALFVLLGLKLWFITVVNQNQNQQVSSHPEVSTEYHLSKVKAYRIYSI